MRVSRMLARILACVGVVLLASCIDGREEIWVNPNGSGRAEVFYSLPEAVALFQGGEDGIRRMISGFLKDNPSISDSTLDVSTEDGRLQVRVKASFDSVLKLEELFEVSSAGGLPASAKYMAGEVKLETSRRSVNFARTISPGKALPGAEFFPRSQTEGHALTYVIHLPKAATESNATRIENEGRTLVWEYPLAEAIRNPVVTEFNAPIPIPFWIPASVFVVLAILAFFVRCKLRKLRGR